MMRLDLLGVEIDAMTVDELYALIEETVESGEKTIIANHNLHSIYFYHRDTKMRLFYSKAKYIHIDSMPLIYLGKSLMQPLCRQNRLTSFDWMPDLLKVAERKAWRIFYLGSESQIVERGVGVWRFKYPHLQIAAHHGYFDMHSYGRENHQIIERINEFSPHLLLVGMGMPRQEHWIVDNLDRIDSKLIINIGGLIDLVASALYTPPRWLGQLGLEGVCRLFCEPARLWRRYLLEPWFLAPLFLRDVRKAFSRLSAQSSRRH